MMRLSKDLTTLESILYLFGGALLIGGAGAQWGWKAALMAAGVWLLWGSQVEAA